MTITPQPTSTDNHTRSRSTGDAMAWLDDAPLVVTVCTADHVYTWQGPLPTANVHRGALVTGAAADATPGQLTLTVKRDAQGLTMHCEVAFSQPVLSVKVSLAGAPRGHVITPPGAVWEPPSEAALCFAYPDGALPSRWRGGESGTAPATGSLPGITSQVLCVEGPDAVIAVQSLDVSRRFKRFWIRPLGETTTWELLEEAAAHAPREQMEISLRIYCADTALEALRRYNRWAAPVHGLTPFEERGDVPGWLGEVSLVVTCHGVSSDERICTNYADMRAHLEALAQHVDPERTLVRLVGWEGRVDHTLPDNSASEVLGGPDGLKKLIETAHRLGYRVILHFNIWGLAHGHPDYNELAEHAILDRYGRRVGWEVDYNHDEVLEPIFLYVSPDAVPFRNRLIAAIRRAIRDFSPDLIHLDQAAFPVNDARHDHQRGIESVYGQLAELEPDVVFLGEGYSEWTAALYPVCEGLSQVWPGMTVRPELFHEMFGQYVRPYAHSASLPPSPHHGVWTYPPVSQWWSESKHKQQEAFLDSLDVIPTLVLTTPGLDLDDSKVRAVVERARRLAGVLKGSSPS